MSVSFHSYLEFLTFILVSLKFFKESAIADSRFKMPHYTRNHSDSLKAFYIENQSVGHKDSTEDWRSKCFPGLGV